MKKIIIAILVLMVLVVSFCAWKTFVAGSPTDGNALSVEVKQHDNQVDIYIHSIDSSLAISDVRYRYEGTVLHISVYRVLSTSLHNDGSKCIYHEITDETQIWLGDRLIWSAE